MLILKEISSLTSGKSKKPPAVNLRDSVAMVVMLMRRNITQEVAGGIFGCSQPTVSRRWDLLRPVIGKVLSPYVPRPVEVLGIEGTALADGTACPTWDWKSVPDLYSRKAGYPGMNVQIAANMKGDVAAIGPFPVHGARHDAHAFEASGLKDILDAAGDPDNSGADLGYTGVEGIMTVPFRKPAGSELKEWQREFNAAYSKVRAFVEHAVAKVKRWRMLSEEGGRYRRPIDEYESMLAAVTGLFFYIEYISD
jgi:hypothetical protein